MTRLFACLCSLIFAGTLVASYPYTVYSHGYRNSHGYYYDGYTGYWHWRQNNTYWRYDPYSYHYIQTYPYPAAPAATPKNYKEVIAESLARRQEHDDFMEALKLAYPDYVAKEHKSSVQSGSTLYGTSSTTVQIGGFPQIDLNVALQQLARSAEFQIQATGQIHTDLADIVQQATAGQRSIAEIIAKGIADAERIRAAAGPPVSIKREFNIGQAKGIGTMPDADPPKQFKALDFNGLNQSCMACHSGTTIKSGFDVTKFDSLPLDRRVFIVREHIMGTGPKAMPRDASGKHAPLPEGVQLQWLMRATKKG